MLPQTLEHLLRVAENFTVKTKDFRFQRQWWWWGWSWWSLAIQFNIKFIIQTETESRTCGTECISTWSHARCSNAGQWFPKSNSSTWIVQKKNSVSLGRRNLWVWLPHASTRPVLSVQILLALAKSIARRHIVEHTIRMSPSTLYMVLTRTAHAYPSMHIHAYPCISMSDFQDTNCAEKLGCAILVLGVTGSCGQREHIKGSTKGHWVAMGETCL